MSSIEHLKQQLQERKTQYDLLSERISRLRTEYALETDVEERFRQETHIKVLDNTRDVLNNEISALESRIEIAYETSQRYKSPKDYLEYQIVKSYQFLVGIHPAQESTSRAGAEPPDDTLIAKYRSALDVYLRVYFRLCANLQLAPADRISEIADELERPPANESRPAAEPLDSSQVFTKLEGTRIVNVVVSQLFRVADLLTRPESVRAQKFYEALTVKTKARRALNRRISFRLGSLGTLRSVTSSTDKYDRFWGPGRPAFASPTTQPLHFIPYELTLSEHLKSLRSEFESVLESAVVPHSETIQNSQISGHLRIYPAGIGVISLGLTLEFVDAVQVEVVAQIAKNIEALLFVDPTGLKQPYEALMLDIVDQVTKQLFTREAFEHYERRWRPPSTVYLFRDDEGLAPVNSVDDLAYMMSLAPANHENLHDLKVRVELALRNAHWKKEHAIAVAGEGVGLFFIGKPSGKVSTKDLLKWLSETHELVSAGAYAEQAFAEEIEKIFDQRLLDESWLEMGSGQMKYLESLLGTMQQVVRAIGTIRTHLKDQGTGILTSYAKDVWTYSNPVNRPHLASALKYIAGWLEKNRQSTSIPNVDRLLETLRTLQTIPSPFPNLPKISGAVRASHHQDEL